jgi:hypothetical protein
VAVQCSDWIQLIPFGARREYSLGSTAASSSDRIASCRREPSLSNAFYALNGPLTVTNASQPSAGDEMRK